METKHPMILHESRDDRRSREARMPYDSAPDTVFAAFMAELMRAFDARATTMAGAAFWTAFPLDAVMATGLWLVLIRTAAKAGYRIESREDVFGDLAPRVNRVLEAGLLIRHGSVSKAAEAFVSEVVELIHHTPRTSECQTLADRFAMPCARFFAEALRAANETATKIERLLHEIERENVALSIRGIECDTVIRYSDWQRDWDQLTVEYLRLNGRDSLAYPPVVSETIQRLEAELALVRRLRRLPLRLRSLPEEAIPGLPIIELQWLRTQMLLALIRAPKDRDHIIGAEYGKALLALSKLSDAEAINHFHRRMRLRDPQLTAGELSWLDGTLHEHVRQHRLRDPRGLSVPEVEELLMTLPQVRFTERDEVVFVEGGEPTTLVPRRLVREVRLQASWKPFENPERIFDLIDAGEASVEEAVEKLPECKPDVRRAFVQGLLTTYKLRPKVLRRLRELNLVEPSPKIVLGFPTLFSAKELVKELHPVLYWAMEHSREVTPKQLDRFFRAMARGDNEVKLRKELLKPSLRQTMAAMIGDLIDPVSPDRDATRLLRTLRRILGDDGFTRYVLSAELSDRAGNAYTSENELMFWPRWEERYLPPPVDEIGHRRMLFDIAKALRRPREDVREQLRKFSERRMYRWLHAALPEASSGLEEYIASRDKYYAKAAEG